MNADVLALLQQKYPEFSKGQRKIAQYITNACDQAAFMTASKLGKIVGVSESTVVRFAVDLGFDGYPSMQKAMQEMVLHRLTSVQSSNADHGRNEEDCLSEVLRSDMEKLRKTGQTLDRQSFQSSVDAIADAKCVWVVGVRNAAPVADFLGHSLNFMLQSVRVVTDSDPRGMFEQIVGVAAEDAVILFDYSDDAAGITAVARYCRSSAAKVIAITNDLQSSPAQNADHTLLAQSEKDGFAASLVAPMSVANALIAAIGAKREQQIQRTMETLERIRNQYHVYEKRDEK